MCTREKKEKAIAMYDTTQSITEVIRRLGYPINRKSGERQYRFGISFSAIVLEEVILENKGFIFK